MPDLKFSLQNIFHRSKQATHEHTPLCNKWNGRIHKPNTRELWRMPSWIPGGLTSLRGGTRRARQEGGWKMGRDGSLGFVHSGSFPARPGLAVMLPPLRTTMHLRQPPEQALATAPCTVLFRSRGVQISPKLSSSHRCPPSPVDFPLWTNLHYS